ncbi:MAG: hypothetical protein LC799_21530 [Actinobacteria bacterium]|nr:hypothetical protein [Actinomycetota bacterium]
MDTLTAAASDLPVGTLLVLALVLLAAYLVAVWWWPNTPHGRCSGTGKLRSPSGKKWRRCPGCGGTGTKPRLGARLLNTTRRRS